VLVELMMHAAGRHPQSGSLPTLHGKTPRAVSRWVFVCNYTATARDEQARDSR